MDGYFATSLVYFIGRSAHDLLSISLFIST